MADVYPAVWESTLAGNPSPEVFDLATKAVWDLAGPCHWAALLCLPAAAAWVIASAARGPAPATLRRARAALAVAAVAAVGVWAVCPFAAESDPGTLNQLRWKYTPGRFGLCAQSLCVLVFCLAAEDLARGLGRVIGRVFAPALSHRVRGRLTRAPAGLVRLAFAAALAYQWGNQDLRNSSDALGIPLRGLWDTALLGANLFLVTYIFAMVMAEIARRHKPLFRYLSLLLLIGALGTGAALTAHRSARWHRDYVAYYDSILGKGVFRKLAEDSSPGDTLCVMDERYYPFFGSARQFRVVQPPATGSAARWQNSPVRQRCDLVIIGPNVKYKWTQARNVVVHNARKHSIYTYTSPSYLVYSTGNISSRLAE
jgi:hypothetical protein